MEFTAAWFEDQREVVAHFLHADSNCELHILEIGAYEGRGTVFYIDNYLQHPKSTITSIDPFCLSDVTTPLTDQTYKRFLSNVARSNYPNKLELHKQYSLRVLPQLIMQDKQYDYITIDGSHLCSDVLVDACLAYRLLKPEGIMFFDDYDNDMADTEANVPKKAIDSFLRCHPDMDVLHKQYHLVAQKCHPKF
jgi:predicted O-methyltransferase YrrM